MDNPETRDGAQLLYDPLFETPPDTVIRDTPGRGFFGKAAVKKAIFILVLLCFVGTSITLSFSSLTSSPFASTACCIVNANRIKVHILLIRFVISVQKYTICGRFALFLLFSLSIL